MRVLVVVGLLAAYTLVGTASAWACGSAPSAAPTDAVTNLDDEPAQWGVYCGGAPEYGYGSVLDPSTKTMLLQLEYLGGGPNDFTHLYRNLLPDVNANDFRMKLRFNYSPRHAGSPADAVQFSMNSWVSEVRYEWAVEWQNLGTGHTWMFWDGHRWLDLGVSKDLTPGTWHDFDIHGSITPDGKVYYDRFGVDNKTFKLGLTVDPVAYPGWPDQLATAVTLVGNGAGDTFDMFVDQVELARKRIGDPATDGPGQTTTTSTTAVTAANLSAPVTTAATPVTTVPADTTTTVAADTTTTAPATPTTTVPAETTTTVAADTTTTAPATSTTTVPPVTTTVPAETTTTVVVATVPPVTTTMPPVTTTVPPAPTTTVGTSPTTTFPPITTQTATRPAPPAPPPSPADPGSNRHGHRWHHLMWLADPYGRGVRIR